MGRQTLLAFERNLRITVLAQVSEVSDFSFRLRPDGGFDFKGRKGAISDGDQRHPYFGRSVAVLEN